MFPVRSFHWWKGLSDIADVHRFAFTFQVCFSILCLGSWFGNRGQTDRSFANIYDNTKVQIPLRSTFLSSLNLHPHRRDSPAVLSLSLFSPCWLQVMSRIFILTLSSSNDCTFRWPLWSVYRRLFLITGRAGVHSSCHQATGKNTLRTVHSHAHCRYAVLPAWCASVWKMRCLRKSAHFHKIPINK